MRTVFDPISETDEIETLWREETDSCIVKVNGEQVGEVSKMDLITMGVDPNEPHQILRALRKLAGTKIKQVEQQIRNWRDKTVVELERFENPNWGTF